MLFPLALQNRLLKWATLTCGALCLFLIGYAFVGYEPPPDTLTGRLLPTALREEIPWRVYSPAQVMSGVTIPPNTHVIIELPDPAPPILRKTLFGTNDPTVRYWGYCLPDTYDRSEAVQGSRLPGKVFLSDGERKVRQEEYERTLRDHFSIEQNLTEEDLNGLRKPPAGLIEHQFETFEPGSICYVMSERPLAVSTDNDDDGANNAVERVHQSNPLTADTDGDGLNDGCEIFGTHSNPIIRDSDGDGIIDGIEDANHNCRYEAATETDPISWDTDRDGLPDGLMKMGTGRKIRLLGEDKNLNGMIDEDETDPRRWSTAADGVSDGQKYWQCVLMSTDDGQGC